MIKQRVGHFGRLVQVRKPSAALRAIAGLKIQTHGMRVKGAVTCTSTEQLKSVVLAHAAETTFVVNTICTLGIDRDTVVLLRSFAALGKTFYLATYNCDRLWFVDDVE